MRITIKPVMLGTEDDSMTSQSSETIPDGGFTASDMTDEAPWKPGTKPATEALLAHGLQPTPGNRTLAEMARSGFTPSDIMQPSAACLENGVMPTQNTAPIDTRTLRESARTFDKPATMPTGLETRDELLAFMREHRVGSVNSRWGTAALKRLHARILNIQFLEKNGVVVDSRWSDEKLEFCKSRLEVIGFLLDNHVKIGPTWDDAMLQSKVDELKRALAADHGLDPAAEVAHA